MNVAPEGDILPSFLPARVANWQSAIAGGVTSGSDPTERDIKCKIENLQTHLSGSAHSIMLDIVGWWVRFDLSEVAMSGFIHVRNTPFPLGLGESITLTVIYTRGATSYMLAVRTIRYRDMWGHPSTAFRGDPGISRLIPDWPKREIQPKQRQRPWPELREGTLYQPYLRLRLWLLKESLLVRFDRLRKSSAARLISRIVALLQQKGGTPP